MPRLVGKKSNQGLLTGVVMIAVIAVTASAIEYLGYTNLIPGWGREQSRISQVKPSIAEPSSTVISHT